jgi:hypothetical protein
LCWYQNESDQAPVLTRPRQARERRKKIAAEIRAIEEATWTAFMLTVQPESSLALCLIARFTRFVANSASFGRLTFR